ncbi:hypothetical protein ALC53_03579, partial [Atta colombica]
AQRYYLLARDSSRGPRRRTTRVVSRCLRMKEPGRPPPSHPPSAVRPPRGGKRARSLYCKPSEQRGNGEDDDDGEDDNNVDSTPYTTYISGRARRRPREKHEKSGTSGENRRHVQRRVIPFQHPPVLLIDIVYRDYYSLVTRDVAFQFLACHNRGLSLARAANGWTEGRPAHGCASELFIPLDYASHCAAPKRPTETNDLVMKRSGRAYERASS